MRLQVGVKALIQNPKGEYLFLRRSAAMDNEATPHWDIPGGRIEPDEPLALAREIREETGLTFADTPKLVHAQDIFVPKANLHVVRLSYSIQGDGEVTLSNEHQETAWMTREKALATNIDSYTREVLERFL